MLIAMDAETGRCFAMDRFNHLDWPIQRARIMAAIRNRGAKPKPETKSAGTPRLLRRAEVARLLSRTTRSVYHLARDGILKRVSLPGRSRAAEFRESDVLELIDSGE